MSANDIIERLREKNHVDFPVVLLSVMFSMSLSHFKWTMFHISFALLVCAHFLVRTMCWRTMARLIESRDPITIVATHIHILSLFALYYAYTSDNPMLGRIVFFLLFTTMLIVGGLLTGIVLQFGAIPVQPKKAIASVLILLCNFGCLLIPLLLPYPGTYGATMTATGTLLLVGTFVTVEALA